MMQSDEEFMLRAVALARSARAAPGASPIGCMIVRDGRVLATAYNEVELRTDPTAHAEILAIRRACAAIADVELRDATLYSTLQPCGMCTMASIWAKLGRIVYGAGKADVHHMYFEDRQLGCTDFVRDAFREDLTVEGGVAVEACAGLYPPPEADVPADQQANL